MNRNTLLLQYAKANLEVDGIYRISVPPASKVIDQATTAGVCGFVIPICGKAKFTVNNEDYILKEGTILHAGSNMALNKEAIGEENWEFILLHYKILQEENQKDSLLNTNYIINIFTDQNLEIMKIIESILSLQKENRSEYILTTKILLYELISKIFIFSESRQNSEPKDRINDALIYIHENLEENLSVAEIAENFQFNAKQFHYSFHKKVGISPKKYIMDTKIKRAKELLLESDLSITEIANQIGYEDALHFSRIFKRNTAASPSVFRKEFVKNPY